MGKKLTQGVTSQVDVIVTVVVVPAGAGIAFTGLSVIET
jgi:hypothetical protein